MSYCVLLLSFILFLKKAVNRPFHSELTFAPLLHASIFPGSSQLIINFQLKWLSPFDDNFLASAY